MKNTDRTTSLMANTKKIWFNPTIIVLATDNIDATKNVNLKVHESTGHTNSGNPLFYSVNEANAAPSRGWANSNAS